MVVLPSRNGGVAVKDEPSEGKEGGCVAKFQNGKPCRYNAKPGRTTCDRPGHSDWENLDTSNSSALE